MGFNIRGGDKSSLALLSSKRGKAYAKSKADEAFALPSFSDAMPAAATLPQCPQVNPSSRNKQPLEQDAENVKQTMLQHESVFKEQLHELHRLYQKQCMLMAESNSDPSLDRVPEPPSSSSSLLCSSGTLRLQEDRTFGDASFPAVSDSNQGYQALLGQMDDIRHLESGMANVKQSSHRITDFQAPNPKPGRHCGFDLEQPAAHRPMIDLEQPAEEHLDVEIHEEKPRIPSFSIKVEDGQNSAQTSVFGTDKAVIKREASAEVSKGPQGNKLFGFHIHNSIASESFPSTTVMQNGALEQKAAVSIHGQPRTSCDKKLFGFNLVNSDQEVGREELSKGCLEGRECEINHVFPSSKASTATFGHGKEEPLLYTKEDFTASGPYQSLPDLNGDVHSREGKLPRLQTFPQKTAKDCQYGDLEVTSRPGTYSSKLPHWLCQAPSARPLPLHGSLQSSISQPRSPGYFPQVQENTIQTLLSPQHLREKTNELNKLPVATTKTSTLYASEPTYPGMQSSIVRSDPRESFAREGPQTWSSQFFHGPNLGNLERSHSGAHVGEYDKGCVPFYYPQSSHGEKTGLSSFTPVNLSSYIMGNQGYGFEAHGPSTEFLVNVNPEGQVSHTPVFPWNQQTETFSSLLQQASNPEPYCKRPSPVISVSPWGITSNYQGLSMLGNDYRDRASLPADARNNESSSLQPKRDTGQLTYERMCSGSGVGGKVESLKSSEYTLCNQAENPLSKGQVPELSSGNHLCDLNTGKMFFDLNLSNEDCMLKGHLDSCNIRNASCSGNRQQSPKPESGMSRSSGWVTLDTIEAPFLYQQEESGVKKACLGDGVRIEGEPATALFGTNMSHLHNDSSYLKKPADNLLRLHNDSSYVSKSADNLYSEGNMPGNDICADYCSGEDETGDGFVEAKSSDGSGLTSCESRDVVHLEHVKAGDDSNTSSGEACHSLESRIPSFNEDVAFSSSFQQKLLPSHVTGLSNSLLLQDMQATSFNVETKMDCSSHYKEFADESEAANVVTRKHPDEALEVAEILCCLGLDVPPTTGEDEIDDCKRGLHWLAEVIPNEDYNQQTDMETIQPTQQPSEIHGCNVSDTFESAVLALKPVDPNIEYVATCPPLERGHAMEIAHTLRRRPSRRGRAGKDFQKEMLRSMNALSRHEITEDLQIIEGLIKSAIEATNSCSTSSEKTLWSPEKNSFRSFGKEESALACKDRKLNGLLNVCTWGETTRRKRMGRQRSQWLSLPPGVRISLFDDTTHVTS